MAEQIRKRGITIFRAEEAAELLDTDFMVRSPTSAEVPPEVRTRLAAGGSGSDVRVLVRDIGGFSLVQVSFKANYPLPRHSHDTDCLYYVVSGSAIMGRQELRAGDSFFVPAGAPYQYRAGPEGVRVLEIRHTVEHFDIDVATVPLSTWVAMAEVFEANAEAWAEESLAGV